MGRPTGVMKIHSHERLTGSAGGDHRNKPLTIVTIAPVQPQAHKHAQPSSAAEATQAEPCCGAGREESAWSTSTEACTVVRKRSRLTRARPMLRE